MCNNEYFIFANLLLQHVQKISRGHREDIQRIKSFGCPLDILSFGHGVLLGFKSTFLL